MQKKYLMDAPQSKSGRYSSRRGLAGSSNPNESYTSSRPDLVDLKEHLNLMKAGSTNHPRVSSSISISGNLSFSNSSGARNEASAANVPADASVNSGIQMKLELSEERCLSVIVRAVSQFLADLGGPSINELMNLLDFYSIRESSSGTTQLCDIIPRDPMLLSYIDQWSSRTPPNIPQQLTIQRDYLREARLKRARLAEYNGVASSIAESRDRRVLESERDAYMAALKRLDERKLKVSKKAAHHCESIEKVVKLLQVPVGEE